MALYLYLSPYLIFLALEEHKADLAHFLPQAPANKNIIVGGRLDEEDTVKCFCPNVNIGALKGFHKEADTRVLVHRVHSNAEFLAVSPQDTDVFLLLISRFEKMSCNEL